MKSNIPEAEMGIQDFEGRNRRSFSEAAGYAVGHGFSVVMGVASGLAVLGVAIFLVVQFGEKFVAFISTYQLNEVII